MILTRRCLSGNFQIDGVPLFDQDIEKDVPIKVKEFKSKIRDADAILIATPECNYSVPGVLKNAIDCASRPYGDNAFEKKPVAIIRAFVGMLGGARGSVSFLSDLRISKHLSNKWAGTILPFAQDKFDANDTNG